MNRIDALFQRKQHRILNIYCTAGFPRLGDTIPVMQAVARAGADMIELGMPYSDPLADGPVIQASNGVAIANGMTIARLFADLANLRSSVRIPVVLMGYMNPILQYGFERFCADAARVGVDGLILPDLPMFEFERDYKTIVDRFGLKFIFLVTPETSDERVRKLDQLSNGFLYAVSSSSTTGKAEGATLQNEYFERLSRLQLRNPVLIGFGIRDRPTFEAACARGNGAIIGTAFIKALEGQEDVERATKTFIHGIIG